MTQEIRFPYRLINAIFTSIRFSRSPKLPDSIEVSLIIGARVNSEQFPDKLQIELQIKTPDERPLMMHAELVSLFELVEGQPEPDRSIIPDFVNERALHMLWPYIVQIVRQITGQMGTNPILLRTPYVFDFKLEMEATEADE